MSKHRKHKKHASPKPDDREMYVCEICQKRFPFEGYVPPASTPFMFMVLGDREHRRFTLAVASLDRLEKFDGEEALWWVCSDRQCIFKSFLLWREWDKRMQMNAYALEQVGKIGKFEPPTDGNPTTRMSEELDKVWQNSVLRQASNGSVPEQDGIEGTREMSINYAAEKFAVAIHNMVTTSLPTSPQDRVRMAAEATSTLQQEDFTPELWLRFAKFQGTVAKVHSEEGSYSASAKALSDMEAHEVLVEFFNLENDIREEYRRTFAA